MVGTKGVVKMDPADGMASTLKAELIVGSRTTKRTFPKQDQFAPEFVYFSDCILNNREPEPSGREGLADVRIIRAVLQSADDNRPVTVRQTEIASRPKYETGDCRAGVDQAAAISESRTAGGLTRTCLRSRLTL